MRQLSDDQFLVEKRQYYNIFEQNICAENAEFYLRNVFLNEKGLRYLLEWVDKNFKILETCTPNNDFVTKRIEKLKSMQNIMIPAMRMHLKKTNSDKKWGLLSDFIQIYFPELNENLLLSIKNDCLQGRLFNFLRTCEKDQWIDYIIKNGTSEDCDFLESQGYVIPCIQDFLACLSFEEKQEAQNFLLSAQMVFCTPDIFYYTKDEIALLKQENDLQEKMQKRGEDFFECAKKLLTIATLKTHHKQRSAAANEISDGKIKRYLNCSASALLIFAGYLTGLKRIIHTYQDKSSEKIESLSQWVNQESITLSKIMLEKLQLLPKNQVDEFQFYGDVESQTETQIVFTDDILCQHGLPLANSSNSNRSPRQGMLTASQIGEMNEWIDHSGDLDDQQALKALWQNWAGNQQKLGINAIAPGRLPNQNLIESDLGMSTYVGIAISPYEIMDRNAELEAEGFCQVECSKDILIFSFQQDHLLTAEDVGFIENFLEETFSSTEEKFKFLADFFEFFEKNKQDNVNVLLSLKQFHQMHYPQQDINEQYQNVLKNLNTVDIFHKEFTDKKSTESEKSTDHLINQDSPNENIQKVKYFLEEQKNRLELDKRTRFFSADKKTKKINTIAKKIKELANIKNENFSSFIEDLYSDSNLSAKRCIFSCCFFNNTFQSELKKFQANNSC